MEKKKKSNDLSCRARVPEPSPVCRSRSHLATAFYTQALSTQLFSEAPYPRTISAHNVFSFHPNQTSTCTRFSSRINSLITGLHFTPHKGYVYGSLQVHTMITHLGILGVIVWSPGALQRAPRALGTVWASQTLWQNTQNLEEGHSWPSLCPSSSGALSASSQRETRAGDQEAGGELRFACGSLPAHLLWFVWVFPLSGNPVPLAIFSCFVPTPLSGFLAPLMVVANLNCN